MQKAGFDTYATGIKNGFRYDAVVAVQLVGMGMIFTGCLSKFNRKSVTDSYLFVSGLLRCFDLYFYFCLPPNDIQRQMRLRHK